MHHAYAVLNLLSLLSLAYLRYAPYPISHEVSDVPLGTLLHCPSTFSKLVPDKMVRNICVEHSVSTVKL